MLRLIGHNIHNQTPACILKVELVVPHMVNIAEYKI